MSRKDYTRYSYTGRKEKYTPPPEVVEERKPDIMGVVAGCALLNVRAEPSLDAEIACQIVDGAELVIDETDSTEFFYRVCTATGVEGYCMKEYVVIRS